MKFSIQYHFVVLAISLSTLFVFCTKEGINLNNNTAINANKKQTIEAAASLIAPPPCPAFQQVVNLTNAINQLNNQANCNLPLTTSKCKIINRNCSAIVWQGCFNQTFTVANLNTILSNARQVALTNKPSGYSIVGYRFNPDMLHSDNCSWVLFITVTYAYCGDIAVPNQL